MVCEKDTGHIVDLCDEMLSDVAVAQHLLKQQSLPGAQHSPYGIKKFIASFRLVRGYLKQLDGREQRRTFQTSHQRSIPTGRDTTFSTNQVTLTSPQTTLGHHA